MSATDHEERSVLCMVEKIVRSAEIIGHGDKKGKT